ncbi:hypothetical protein PCPL58_p2063 (plasmid) [Pseudomonas cerasi]|uniref:Uncharacterized protein n=1 Tax=Pseudomonas cerasi TaxID=1583341 RepID=A0A193SGE3_9PSED|nr:hypothetical protein PCPL58_p2063 [Pseudomonas cerasi]SOS30413.1 hypothetical protein PL963_P400041 [Pseudomonas cerasi]
MDAKSSVFQSHLILVGCARLQVEVAGCRFVCSQCWFAVPDRRNQSRSKNAMIAGRGHFDCRSLQIGKVKSCQDGNAVTESPPPLMADCHSLGEL